MDNNSTNKCPLCGGDNQCAMAAGQPAQTCWCMKADISADSIAALPKTERGVRCICPGCGRSERKEH